MTTVRTIKLKRSSQAYGESSGSVNLSTPAAAETTPSDGSAPDSPTAATLAPGETATQGTGPAGAATAPVAVNTVPGKSPVWFMLVALTAVLGLLVILGLQYSELSFYKLAPSVWTPGR